MNKWIIPLLFLGLFNICGAQETTAEAPSLPEKSGEESTGSPSTGATPVAPIVPQDLQEAQDSQNHEGSSGSSAAPPPAEVTEQIVPDAPTVNVTPTPVEEKSEPDLWDPEFLVSEPPEKEIESSLPQGYFERTYLGVSQRVVNLANSVDSIFGDRRATDEYDGSTLRVTQNARWNDTGFGTQDLSLSLNLQLPNLNEVEKSWRERITSESKNLLSELNNSEAVGKKFKEENPWEFNQETGIRTRWPLSYFSQLRARRNYLTVAVVHHALLQVGWDSEAQWEQKAQMISDYAIHKDLLFRFVNEQNWAMTNHIVGTIHGPSLIQQIDDDSAISYDARFTTLWESEDLFLNNYTLGTTYRRALTGRRMFIEIRPEFSWPKFDNHAFNWDIYVSLELLFGKATGT